MKKNKILFWIFAVIIVLLVWLFIVQQWKKGDQEIVEIDHYVSQNWYFSMMDFTCKNFKTSQWEQYCETHQKKLQDFFKDATWEELKPQIKEKGMILFPCNMLNEKEEKICDTEIKKL